MKGVQVRKGPDPGTGALYPVNVWDCWCWPLLASWILLAYLSTWRTWNYKLQEERHIAELIYHRWWMCPALFLPVQWTIKDMYLFKRYLLRTAPQNGVGALTFCLSVMKYNWQRWHSSQSLDLRVMSDRIWWLGPLLFSVNGNARNILKKGKARGKVEKLQR